MDGFVEIQASNGQFAAWSARPAGPNGAGLVLLPEVFNVNDWVRRTAARYAQAGFDVLAPDLYWRQQPGVHLRYREGERAMALGDALDLDAAIDDVGHCAARLRAQLGTDARVGAVGFCLGGRLAVLAALRGQVQAAEAYYPVRMDAHFLELPAAPVPLLLHFGEDDPWIPAATVAGVVHALAGCAHAAVEIYPGAGHGFARDGYPPFHAPAAALARRRGLAFLRLNLVTARG